MPIVRAAKKIAVTVERFFVYRVLSLDDTPHRIALGVAIGIFVTWTPTIGLQMALTVALAALFRANKIVGVPFVWISNPLTIVPIYYPNYLLGCWLLGKKADSFSVIQNAINFTGGWMEKTEVWAHAVMQIFWEMWLGSLIVAGILGIITYFVIYFLVVNYRKGLHALQEHMHHHHETEEASGTSETTGDMTVEKTLAAAPQEDEAVLQAQNDQTDGQTPEQTGQTTDEASDITEEAT